MRHTVTDLLQMQSLPLESKVQMTKARIKAWYEYWDGQVYVSFSGGKDSTVLKHIVDSMYDDVPSVFVNTGLEYPEVRRFAMAQKNVIRIDPEIPFHEVIKIHGYPIGSKEIAKIVNEARRSLEINPNADTISLRKLRGTYLNEDGTKSRFCREKWQPLLYAPFKTSHRCCDIMKKNPCKKYEAETGRKAIIGTMATDSHLRRNAWFEKGCNAFDDVRPMSKPLSFWTENDILEYIDSNGLAIPEVYGEIKKDENGTYSTTGLKNTGCMFCLFGVQLEKYPNRFQRMEHDHPKQWKYCMENLGIRQVLEYIHVPWKDEQLNLFDK